MARLLIPLDDEAARSARGGHPDSLGVFMGGFWRDVKLGARALARRPGFTSVAVVTLALGIGANAAVFSVVNGLIFQPLPVPEAGRLVALCETEQGSSFPHGMSYPNLLDYRSLDDVFSAVEGYNTTMVRMSLEGSATYRILPQVVTPGFFEMLRLPAALGRTFRAAEVTGDGADNVIVLSQSGFERYFGSDPSIVGRTVRLNDHPFTVLGVTPEAFHGTIAMLEVDGFVPTTGMERIEAAYAAGREDRSSDSLRVIARLRPGVGLAAARAAVAVQSERLATEYPEANKAQVTLVYPEPMARMEPAAVRYMPPVATVFMGLVGLVLLIACANVANLLLARGISRRKEMAIRLSLGAGRGQVLRQLLAESLVLSVLGGAAALLLAQWAGHALASFRMATDLPMRMDFSLDRHVFLFTLGVALLTGLVVGLLPGLRAGRGALAGALQEGGRAVGATSRRSLRNALVMGQVSVSVALLVCAGLFVRTAANVTRIDLGFEPHNRLILTLDLGLAGYDEARGRAFYRSVLDQVRALPEVTSAATGQYVPVGYSNEQVRVHVEGKVEPAGEPPKQALANVVTPDFFRTLGTPLLAGRAFSPDDNAEGRPVAVVNQALADTYWPGEESLGQRIRVDEGPPLEVVGVVKTAKYLLPAESPIPMVYRPLEQSYRSTQVLFVSTADHPLAALPAIRSRIQALDPQLPIFDVRTLESHIRDGKAKLFGLAAWLVGIFGLIGAVLASVGLYGVTAYAVGQRRHEFGVRMALGARPGRILSLVLKQGAVVAAVGVGLGLLLSALITRGFANLLVDVSPTDPLTFGVVALLVALVALLACAVPARQAARVDPMAVLRQE
jgi:predicted permease